MRFVRLALAWFAYIWLFCLPTNSRAWPIDYDRLPSPVHRLQNEPEGFSDLLSLLIEIAANHRPRISQKFLDYQSFYLRHRKPAKELSPSDAIAVRAIEAVLEFHDYSKSYSGELPDGAFTQWSKDPNVNIAAKEELLYGLILANRPYHARVLLRNLSPTENNLVFGYLLNEMLNQEDEPLESVQYQLKTSELFSVLPDLGDRFTRFLVRIVENSRFASEIFSVSPRSSFQLPPPGQKYISDFTFRRGARGKLKEILADPNALISKKTRRQGAQTLERFHHDSLREIPTRSFCARMVALAASILP